MTGSTFAEIEEELRSLPELDHSAADLRAFAQGQQRLRQGEVETTRAVFRRLLSSKSEFVRYYAWIMVTLVEMRDMADHGELTWDGILQGPEEPG